MRIVALLFLEAVKARFSAERKTAELVLATVISPSSWARLRSGAGGDALSALAAALALLVFHAARGFPTLADSGGDNDSLLRLVQVRDLLAGQGWFDPTQYRMGPEGGFAMHWSRLVDLPVALLVEGFGETAALVIWPSLLFALALFLLMRSACALGGEWAGFPAMVVGGLALYFINVFPPGALDHHNVQLVLALAAFLFLLHAREGARVGAMAGICAALMLAVGMEAAPYAAAACALVAICFLVGDEADARTARGYGAGFAGVSAGVLVATLPARDWLSVQCDAFSFPQASLAVLGGGGLALIAAVPLLAATPRSRLAALGGLAAAAAALMLAAFPQCLADPYADLHPSLRLYWLSAVSEAQSVVTILRNDPAMFAGFYMTPLIALAVTGWTMARRGVSRERVVAFAFLAAALLVSFWQVRGAMFSLPLAAILLAAWIGEMRRRAQTQKSAVAQLAMVASWLVSLNILWQLAALPLKPQAEAVEANAARAERCYALADYEALAALPAGTVLAVSNQGSSILRQTPHRVLNGPYHRNNAGNLAALEMLMGDPEEAEAAARQHGVGYVAFCRGNPETASLRKWAPQGLLARLAEGSTPDWLEPVAQTRGQAIEVWRVVYN